MKMADPSQVRNAVLKELSRMGHSGRADIRIMKGMPRYSARTTIIDRTIEMKLDPDQSHIEKQRPLKAFLGQRNISEPVMELGVVLGRHEATHTSANIEGRQFGCPGTIENHYEMFMEEVLRALAKKGHRGRVDAAAYIANLVQDLIVNYAGQKAGSMDGDMLFMYEEGTQNGFAKIYEAFSKLYVYINGKKDWNNLLRRFYKNEKQTNEAVSKIVKELGLQGECASDHDALLRNRLVAGDEQNRRIPAHAS